jgi:hypothetical protein
MRDTRSVDHAVSRELEQRRNAAPIGGDTRRRRGPGPLVDVEDLITLEMGDAKGVGAKGIVGVPPTQRGDAAAAPKALEPAPIDLALRQPKTAANLYDDCGSVKDVLRRVKSRQRVVDTKALTGRGAHARVRNAKAVVDQIHQDMLALAELSSKFGKGQIFLTVHRRDIATGATMSLRWRGYRATPTGAIRAHLSWAEADSMLANQPYQTAKALATLNVRARELNNLERQARQAQRHHEALVNLSQTIKK